MIKVKFWVNDVESEIFEYDYESEHDNGFIREMEADRERWTFEQINAGYTIIK